jgi:hypothetical protein
VDSKRVVLSKDLVTEIIITMIIRNHLSKVMISSHSELTIKRKSSTMLKEINSTISQSRQEVEEPVEVEEGASTTKITMLDPIMISIITVKVRLLLLIIIL